MKQNKKQRGSPRLSRKKLTARIHLAYVTIFLLDEVKLKVWIQ